MRKKKVISVFDRELKISIYRDLEVLQEKLDLLFTTSRLMGYRAEKEYLDVKDFSTYTVYLVSEAKNLSAILSFHIVWKKVEKITIVTNKRMVFQKYHEKELLDELDKLLIYI